MTIAIAAIVATIGIPSFRYVTNSNRIAGEVNGLLGDLQFARAEAIKEGQNVTVCVSTVGATCDGTSTWQSGWIVYSNPTGATAPVATSILRIQTTFTSTDTFVAVARHLRDYLQSRGLRRRHCRQRHLDLAA